MLLKLNMKISWGHHSAIEISQAQRPIRVKVEAGNLVEQMDVGNDHSQHYKDRFLHY